MPRGSQDDVFRVSTWGPTNDEQAVCFQRVQAMTEIAFVRVEGAHQLLMATGNYPPGPLGISGQPLQDLFLELG
jgi:hypothetical protein